MKLVRKIKEFIYSIRKKSMKVGDKVKHMSGNFNFVGTVIGEGKKADGEILYIVQQHGSNYCQVFSQFSLKPMTPVDWFEQLPVIPEPLKKPEFPIVITIPERALPHGSPTVNGYRSRIKLNILPPRPKEMLHSGFLKVEVEFSFTGTVIGDIDNLTKPILDLLKGSVIVDDGQVRELACRVMPMQPVSSVKITITEYVPKPKV